MWPFFCPKCQSEEIKCIDGYTQGFYSGRGMDEEYYPDCEVTVYRCKKCKHTWEENDCP